MKTIELKQLLSFAPYKVRGIYTDGTIWECDPLADETDFDALKVPLFHFFGSGNICKLILYPLDFLTKEIEHNGEKFVPIQRIFDRGLNFIKAFESRKNYCMAEGDEKEPIITEIPKDVTCIPYWQVQKLLEWHIDIFDLIPQGLAIDKSKL